MDISSKNTDVHIKIGHDELVIRGRYETLSIINDVLIGVIFLIGSFFFFSDSTMVMGTWLFVVGSILMLIRPSIRITRRFHLQNMRKNQIVDASPVETSFDF
ncbi:YrhK family protein [uncultured Rothia sp.]|uniref:YrhK family protein n=1 Tax=uncultured Rothia sp. TaxID=316088 RepID=UPI003216B03F